MADGPDQSTDQLTPLQNAVYLLKQAQSKMAAAERAKSEPIAIVGMACRFPGSENVQDFWKLLCDGVDAVGEVPADRWNIDDYYDPDPSVPGKMNTRWGGFLKKVDEFDAEFFGISPRETIRVDPQHRLLLEVAWEALENAGIPPSRIARSKTGVYIGAIGNDYALIQAREMFDMDIFTGTGGSHAILANRLSYFLNLSGPSLSLDTACSSSLVTIHLACQSLRRRETDMALAGGVNLILGPEMTVTLTKAHMMADDGRCKAFDAAANGYVRGEGCGVIVLKRLSDAVANGDPILALIRGTAVNHDGRSNGLSAPNGPAQEAVIRAALADAQLDPIDISYVEAHGTGTKLGDPIEIEALRSVLTEGRPNDRSLVVGSVKTNIGHLESAAGIAGLIKVVLMMQNARIPAHLHLKTINPLLRLDGASIEIPTTMQDWRRDVEPRRAGVSAFGFGGTNGHVILEEYARSTSTASTSIENAPERPVHLLALSARSPQALGELAARYVDHVEANPSTSLANIAHTANTSRESFSHRAAIVASNGIELIKHLRSLSENPADSGVRTGQCNPDRPMKIGFLFTGQGAQYAGMGRTLYETQPTFRTTIDRCAKLLKPLLDRPLLSLLDPQAGTMLDQTGYTQPVMFAIEYALATMWRSWGVEPAAVLGHSVGEFAAACTAGVLSLEDGVRLIAQRARLMQALPSGGLMAAVFAVESRVSSVLSEYQGRVTIAALNGPESVVISGDEPAVREVLTRLEADGVKSKVLATSHAFHSHHMEPMLGQLRQTAAEIRHASPTIDIISNLTGRVADANTYADPDYWPRHARSPVRFAEGIRAMAERGCELFLEIGPNPTLVGMGQRCLTGDGFTWLPSLRSGRDDWQSLLDSLAQLYVRGATIDWVGFDRDYPRKKVLLPHYPFQRKRYWTNVSEGAPTRGMPTTSHNGRIVHPLLGRRVIAATSDRIFESELAQNRPALLGESKVQGAALMPAAAYLEMAMAAATVMHGQPRNACDVTLFEPLLLQKTTQRVQTIVSKESDDIDSFRIVGVGESEDGEPTFTTLATGRLTVQCDEPAATETQASFPIAGDSPIIERLRESNVETGTGFAWIEHFAVEGNAGVAELRAPRDADHTDDYRLHPGWIDSAFQLLRMVVYGAGDRLNTYVPMGLNRLEVFDSSKKAARCSAILRQREGRLVVGDAQLFDDEGRCLATLEGILLHAVPRDWLPRRLAGPLPEWHYELTWVPQSLDAQPEAAASEIGEEMGVSANAPSRWLVFDSHDRLGTALAARLELKGDGCTVIPAGGDDASRRAALQQFLSAEVEQPARGVVYLSGLDVDGLPETPDFEAARQHGWGGVLDVVHGMTDIERSQSPRLWLVTRGAQSASNSAHPLCLAQSPIWGLGRVVASEHPNLACTRIDLDPEDCRHSADQLVEEILLGQSEDQVLYRSGERCVARLKRLPVRSNVTSESPDVGLSLRDDGAYLVTGGLGGLGLRVAQWLVDRGVRHLVLLGRSGASDEAKAVLDALKDRGAKIDVRRCDIGKRDEIAAVLDEVRRESTLRGVFHLAGVLDDGVLREQTRERFDRVMSSKMLGAWYLHELTRDDPLDLFVLFSSAAALLGSPGQGNYASANAFLDALAHHRRAQQRPGLSVNWGSWGEVGMAARLIEAEGRRWEAAGIGWIEPDRGLHSLEQLIADERIQVGVLPIDWPKFFARIPVGSEPAWLEEIAQGAREAAPTGEAAPVLREELEKVTPAERLELALTHIRKQAARVLAIDESTLPDPRRTLNELGFDSLTAVEFANRVGRSIGQTLNASVLFDYPTLESLAGHVVRDMLELETDVLQLAAGLEPAVDEEQMQAVSDVEEMSEDEMEAIVMRQLERLGG
jgi:acyl transferase domain-containing protein/acyl carrier protein